MLSCVPVKRVEMSIVALSSWWLATHSSSHLLGFGIGAHLGSSFGSSLGYVVHSSIGSRLGCILGGVLGSVADSWLDSSLVFPLVTVSESLSLTQVLMVGSLVSCCFGGLVGPLGVFQIVLLAGALPGTVSFFINVRSACNMSHSESITYLRYAVEYASIKFNFLIMLKLLVYRWILHEISIASTMSSL